MRYYLSNLPFWFTLPLRFLQLRIHVAISGCPIKKIYVHPLPGKNLTGWPSVQYCMVSPAKEIFVYQLSLGNSISLGRVHSIRCGREVLKIFRKWRRKWNVKQNRVYETPFFFLSYWTGGVSAFLTCATPNMASPGATSLRALTMEFKALQREPVEGFVVTIPNESDFYTWQVAIFGPPDTPYQSGYFKVRMNFTFPQHVHWLLSGSERRLYVKTSPVQAFPSSVLYKTSWSHQATLQYLASFLGSGLEWA